MTEDQAQDFSRPNDVIAPARATRKAHLIPLWDRSRAVTDWQCARKRYLAYEWQGRGLQSTDLALELFLGTILHDAMAEIATQHPNVDIDSIAVKAQKTVYATLMAASAGEAEGPAIAYAMEQSTLVEGMLRGFYKHVWPTLMALYPNIIAIEQEMQYEHDGLIFMSRPDLVVADSHGNNFYLEYKSTSSKKDTWINSWGTAVQLHSSIRAVESSLGIDVTGVQVIGLYKGYESYGKQSSPFCYAYRRAGNPPFSREEFSHEYKPGFRRHPVWELPGGVKAWVAGMTSEQLADQYPVTPQIFINDALVDSFFTQRAYREHEIKVAMQMMEPADEEGRQSIMDIAFPQKFSECSPAYGRPCQFKRICHGGVTNPLEQGWELRQAHHTLEMERHAQ